MQIFPQAFPPQRRAEEHIFDGLATIPLTGVTYDPFVCPILALPNMDFDQGIANLARRKRVNLLWRSSTPAEAVVEILRAQPVRPSLPWGRIAHEVQGVTDGLIRLDPAYVGLSCPKSPDNSPTPDQAPPSKQLLIRLGRAVLVEAHARLIQVRTSVRR